MKLHNKCGKTEYSYRDAARAVVRQRIRRKIELRQYHCKSCGKYHVTGEVDYEKFQLRHKIA